MQCNEEHRAPHATLKKLTKCSVGIARIYLSRMLND
jgi:hypothetical protein